VGGANASEWCRCVVNRYTNSISVPPSLFSLKLHSLARIRSFMLMTILTDRHALIHSPDAQQEAHPKEASRSSIHHPLSLSRNFVRLKSTRQFSLTTRMFLLGMHQ